MAAKKSNFYLTREELIREIVLSKQKQKEHPEKTPAECFTPNLTNYLCLMVNRYANKGQWRGYSYISDMKSDALLTLCMNAFKYDETRYDNPFGYYTQIIKYCFITFLEKEENIRDIKDSLWESIGMTPSYARQIKNEMLKDATDQSTKGVKALKKSADAINQRIGALSLIGSKLARGTAIPGMELDLEIAEILEIGYFPYTGHLESALRLFVEPPVYTVEENVEIAGQITNCLSVYDASTKSHTKRIIPNVGEATVIQALCSIGLSIRRDLLVKQMREMTGYNVSGTRMPTAERMVPTTDTEFGEDKAGTDYLMTSHTPHVPKRRGRKKNGE